jgi:hypothetical protein
MSKKRKSKTLHSKTHLSVKKVMYVVFSTNQGPAIQIATPKGKSINANFKKARSFINLRNISKTADQQLVSLMSDCCMTMLRYPKRALSENI